MSFDEDEKTSTQSQTGSVELVEALVRSAMATRRPDITIASMQGTLHMLLTQHQGELTVADRTRLAAMIETVAEWSTNGQSAAWRQQMLGALDERQNR
jgi:hypothetical protein